MDAERNERNRRTTTEDDREENDVIRESTSSGRTSSRVRPRGSSSDDSSEEERKRRKKKKKSRKKEKKRRKKKKKKKKKRKRRSSSSDDDDDSSEEEGEEENGRSTKKRPREEQTYGRVLTKEDKKRAREEKRAKKRQALLGYTNSNNPFGDSQLSKPFVWHKKNVKDVATGKTKRAPTVREQREMRDRNIEEIRKVQKRREEREREKQEQEQLRDLEMRLREAEQYQDWEEKEEAFNQNQMKRKVVSRAMHGRETVLDALAKNYLILDPPQLSVHDDPDAAENPEHTLALMSFERRNPWDVMADLSIDELEELHEGIQSFATMTRDKPHGEYWSEMMVLVTARLREKRAARHGGHRRRTVAESVRSDIDALYQGHTVSELKSMASEIQSTIDRGHHGGATVDVEFYEKQLQQLREYTARARLREFDEIILQKRREVIERSRRDGGGVKNDDDTAPSSTHDDATTTRDSNEVSVSVAGRVYDVRLDYRDVSTLSPRREPDDGADDIVDELADSQQLQEARRRVLAETHDRLARVVTVVRGTAQSSLNADKLYEAEVAKGRGDELKDGEVQLSAQNITWAEKYRPRKPRYFNRVKTGYDWNKYNKTHYDHDNPPPKTVQGYKFNIFYPDLIDRSKAPQYFLEPCEGETDFCIIRFHAGPPYEDIAFKIVNKEWATQRRRGFKCVFDRGVLHLYFNFKRHFYRR